ncbi:amino acid adenylation domain-containing protein/non-ribosomal peptide synthase protein (TIGR01720 family) [Kibdelosporangium banguiense]|uniref:Amino acid adenylation domain-containing protein/non-ribosomal peptide synthase protein (TIGR01720 family) n=1 Tax=Kibdelosporangium banguiense TaxID=1365924 RepID=A0ABS4TVV6_9PSEU|nr:non-ribosomal peptide synthetase [Kibdelosporangium banguiense]MBP2328530.1 amino acid adenylation domain-containing protein/non-ribosomal peptide synthase protein (TIGR01720 family) [Kibdelosporangium banguiense]
MTTTPFDTHGLSPAKLALLARRLRGEGGNAGGGIPRRPEGEPVALPPAQHSLWVVDQVLADNSVYSVHREWWLSGRLDPGALRRALDDLVRRHEILRTTYLDAGDNQPVQVIHPFRGADLRVVDLTGVPGGQREQRAVRLAEAELRRPFDLAAGPVFRAALFQVDIEEHLLLLNMHHLVSDGWSCAVLGRELGELYSAHVHGRRPVLPELPIQYADYAHWQARRVAGELRDQQLGYWRSALEEIRPLLALPTDRPYPAVPSHRAAQVKRTLPAAMTSAVRALARDHGVTVFTTVLTAFAVVLGRCSGQDTFSVGSLTSGRGHAEVADLLGLFANTVPVPADLRGEPTFAELLDRTHRAVLGALDHQDVSFDQIVAAVAPNREPARNPLFQVLFQLIERGEESWRFASLDTRYADLHNDTGKVDLALFAVDLGERLELQVEYSTDLLLTETADRFADRVVRVLDQVIANPGARLPDVDVLPDRERVIVTDGWNDTAADYPRATLPALFENAVRRAPDSVAVTDVDGDTVSYCALNTRANRLAHHLRALGIGAESVVGVCVEHSVDMFAALLGVLKAGAAYVPLDPEHPADRLAFMLSDTGARVVVTQDAAASAVPAEFDGTLVSLDGDAERLAGRPGTDPVAVTGPDNLVYVMYTSGSTGRPKGVMISHAGLVNYLWWAIDGYGLDGASGAPMLGSIAFDLSVPNFFLPLIGGKDVTLLPKDKSLSALADLLRGPGDFSLLKLTPGHLDVLRGMLPDADRVDCVRTFVVGADEVRPETVAAWRKAAPNARIIDEYGPTETVVGCSTYLVDESFDPSVPVSIGRPIANIRMYVLDDRLEPVPVGAVGELCIGGAGVARGYLNRRGLTAEKFVPDPFAPTPGERMYRTGDLARFRADGNLDFLGRIDHQVKILGYRIELGEIEARLLLHEGVSEAVVVAREDVPGHKRLVAYVVPAGDLDVEELRSAAAKSLPAYMVPRVWQVLDRMPLTQAGKVDRRALPVPEGATAPICSQQAPTTPTEAALAEIWARVLDVDRVGVHDDFFHLGGDSILAIQIGAQARRAGLAVTVRQVFEHRTVATLAAAIGSAAPVAVRADQHTVSGTVTLTPILRWFTQQRVRHDHYNQSVLVNCQPAVHPDVLTRALDAVVDHHDSLRMRLSRVDGQWRAEIAEAEAGPLVRVVDLTGLSDEQRRETRDRAGQGVHIGLSLTGGPIVSAVLFTENGLGTELLIAVNHVAVDTVSWNILLEDLDTAHRQLDAGEPVTLPAKSTSLQYWAKRLTDHANSPEFAAEAALWATPAATPTPIPADHDLGPNCEESGRVVEVALPEDVTDALVRRVPAAYRTEINDVLLTALVRTITEWTGGDAALVELEGHGREPLFDDVDLSRTVGWFTSVLPVQLRLAGDGWGAQLKATKERLRAVPRHGIGHGLARHLRTETASALAAAPQPEVSFNYLGRLDRQREAGGRFIGRDESLGTHRDPQGERGHLIGVTAFVAKVGTGNTLRLYWSYSANRHTEDTVRRLAERYLAHLTDLIDHCVAGGTIGATPSDFPLAGLDQPVLDRLLDRLPVPAGDVADLYPLSPLQSGMLFRSIFDPESADYFEQTGFVLRGEFDAEVFQTAWRQGVDRHPALRTIFAWDALPHPLQVVLRHQPVRFERLDWTGVEPAEIPQRLDAALRAHRGIAFDLTAECASRLTIVRTSATEHYFLWSLHHILLDAWSVAAVLSEVLATYRALRAGQTPEPAAVTPFRDYIAWTGKQDRAADDEFWRGQLAGLTTPTLLAPSSPIAADPGEAHVNEELTAELTAALQSLALRSGCTVGTVLQAAWALVLAAHTGRRHVVFGTTVTGRTAAVAGIEHMIGMLINTLPCAVLVDPDRTVAGYLADQQTAQLGLREHEHCSLAAIQRHAPVPAGTALFDTFFSYRNFTGRVVGTDTDAELDIGPLPYDFEQTGCPLMLNVNHHDTVCVTAIYRRSLFDENTCVAMIERYVAVLRDLAANPDAPLRELPALAWMDEVVAVSGAEEDGDTDPTNGHVAPRGERETAIAGIWARVLGLDHVGAHDDFFDLGGDSIVAIQIVAEARRIGVPVTLPLVFKHRTVARLAQAIAADTAAPVQADQHAVSGAVVLTPILHWFTERPIHHDHYNQSVLLSCQPAVRPDVLQRALAALADHHDALRIRLSTMDGRWVAEIREAGTEPLLRVTDLSGLPGEKQQETRERVASEIQSGLSMLNGQILAAALFTGGDRGTELMIVIHHVAVDTVSWNILLEDLDTACRQLETGHPVTLPPKSTSLQYWAKRLTDHANSPEFAAEAAYWVEQTGEPAPAIPVDHDRGPNTGDSARAVTVTLPAELTDALVHRVPAAYRTEINDVLLTALARTVTEWTGGSCALVELEGHGREPLFDDVDLSRTVGWFTDLVPVTLPAVEGGWGTALKTVKEQLRAVPHHGIGHGLARYLRTDTTQVLAATPDPLLLFNYVGRLDRQRGPAGRFSELPDRLAADRAGESPRSYLINVEAAISGGQLRVHWVYSTHRHREDTVRRISERYLHHLTELIEHCAAGACGATPSDFPLAGLDQPALDRMLAMLPDSARDVEDVYPLSPLQSGMLFHVLRATDPADYLVQKVYAITGALDVDAFVAAWQGVVDRHAVLRTTFAWEGVPQPVQVVWRHRPVELERLDWTGVRSAEIPSRIQARLRRDLRAGFDLAAECPSRLTVITTRNEHYLLWNLHHIVLDAWSIATVLDEVLAGYGAACAGAEADLPAVTPFRDHIAWGHDRESDADFWRAELAGLSAPVPLSTRSAVDGCGVGRVFGELPAELVTRLNELAVRCRSTAGTVLQTAWALLLSGHTGSRDVVFGTTVAGRATGIPGVERMVGMLMNTVPTRVRIDPSQSLTEFIPARQTAQLGLREREHCALADVQRWSPVPAGTPLFDTVVNYVNFGQADARTAGPIELRAVPGPLGQTGQPLVIELNQHDRIELLLSYDRSRFDEAQCARLLDHFGQLVHDILDAPQAPLGEFLARIPAGPVPVAGGGRPADPAGSRVAARTGAERVLAGVWKRVLGVEDVGVHEDFFDVGGNSILVFQVVTLAQKAGLGITVQQALRHRKIAELAASVVPGQPARSAETPAEPAGEIPLPPAPQHFIERDVNHDHHNQSVLLTWRRPPDPDLVERALQAVMAHHDGPRLRVSRVDGDARLTVAEPTADPILRVVETNEDNTVGAVADEVNASLSLSGGPLLRAALLLDPAGLAPARLLLVAHQIAVDLVSWSILLDDLTAAYRQLDSGAEPTLPPVGTQYRRWARRLAEYPRTTRFAEQSAFWLARRPQPAEVPVDRPGGRNTEGARQVVETALPVRSTETLLREAPTTFGARLDEVLLSAVATAIARWTGAQNVVVDLESHGREPLTDDMDLGRTVGWLSVVYPLHIHLPGPDPIRRLTAVREQLRAVPQRGIGHGLSTDSDGRACSQVSFAFHGQGFDRPALGPDALFEATTKTPGTSRDPRDPRPHLLTIDAGVSGGRATVRWTYSPESHDRATIERVAGYCLEELRALAERHDTGPGPGGDLGRRLTERLFPHAPALVVPMARHRVPAIGVALIVGGERVASWGEGITGGEHSRPVQPSTLFPCSSVSKHVTTAGVLRLVQQGSIALDETVDRYLTSWRLPPGEPVTLRQLLGHTAGLMSGVTPSGYVQQPRGTRPALRPMLDHVVRDRPPGTGFRYSNAHFAVVQQVVADVTGTSFADAMRSLVLGPLGMADSGFEHDFPEARADRTAHGHDADGVPYPGGWSLVADIASSGLWTTADDLATLELAILRAATGAGTGFLTRELATQMVLPAGPRYGLGTTITRGTGTHWFGHPGDRRTHQALTAIDLHSGSGLVVLANIGGEAPLLANVADELGLDIDYRVREG